MKPRGKDIGVAAFSIQRAELMTDTIRNQTMEIREYRVRADEFLRRTGDLPLAGGKRKRRG